MGQIRTLQAEMWAWSSKNFPRTPFGIAALGLSEEIGELAEIGEAILGLVAQWGRASRAIVKGDQDIRGGSEQWRALLPKELADCFIKIIDVANRSDIDLESAIRDRWAVVSQRVAGSNAEAARGPAVESVAVTTGQNQHHTLTSGSGLVKCAVDSCKRMIDEDNPHFPFCGMIDANYQAQRETI